MQSRSPKQTFYLVLFAILILIATHFILNLGLSFTNASGCYRAYTPSSGTLTPTVQTYYDALQSQCQQLL